MYVRTKMCFTLNSKKPDKKFHPFFKYKNKFIQLSNDGLSLDSCIAMILDKY